VADTEWLRNLAAATYRGGHWEHLEPHAVQELAQARLAHALQDLMDLAQESALVFNDCADGRRSIRVLELAPRPETESQGGFMLLAGRCQLMVERRGTALATTLMVVRGFQRQVAARKRLEPQVDPFGSLVWQGDNALLMTGDLIIKNLFEDLARVAFDAG